MADPVLNPPVEKKWYESKMIWTNLLMGLAMILSSFYAPASDFIKLYFSEMGIGWSLLNILMRLITKREIV
jgi:uncharacterized membrane protein